MENVFTYRKRSFAKHPQKKLLEGIFLTDVSVILSTGGGRVGICMMSLTIWLLGPTCSFWEVSVPGGPMFLQKGIFVRQVCVCVACLVE